MNPKTQPDPCLESLKPTHNPDHTMNTNETNINETYKRLKGEDEELNDDNMETDLQWTTAS